jgi:hypothetical protein
MMSGDHITKIISEYQHKDPYGIEAMRNCLKGDPGDYAARASAYDEFNRFTEAQAALASVQNTH